MTAAVSSWAWFALAYFLATAVKAVAEVIQTRMKLAFALKLLQHPDGRDDPESARKDIDAVRQFISPSLIRPAERTNAYRFRPKRTGYSGDPVRRGTGR